MKLEVFITIFTCLFVIFASMLLTPLLVMKIVSMVRPNPYYDEDYTLLLNISMLGGYIVGVIILILLQIVQL